MPERSGFVALFEEVLDRKMVEEMVAHWMSRFGRVEQVLPGGAAGGVATVEIGSVSDVFWEEQPQFRIVEGDTFAWVYLSMGRKSIETTGFSTSGIPLSLELLLELPLICDIIDEKNEARLTQLEQEGIL